MKADAMHSHDLGGSAEPEPCGTSVTLVAGPFTHGARLRRFVEAVAALPGVRDSGIVALEQGMLSLALRYAGESLLVEQLQSLPEFDATVEHQDDHRLVLRLTA
jgi:hypothetical protein